MAIKRIIKFEAGKRYNCWNHSRYFISVTKRTSSYLYFTVYVEEKVLAYYPVYDFRRRKLGDYKTPINRLSSEDDKAESFFIVEYNDRVWFKAEDVRH